MLHQIELSQKSQSTRLGLNMASSLFPVWTHGGARIFFNVQRAAHGLAGDVVEMMLINKHVAQFRADMAASPTYLQDKVRRYFIDNPHKLTATMSPDAGYAEAGGRLSHGPPSLHCRPKRRPRRRCSIR